MAVPAGAAATLNVNSTADNDQSGVGSCATGGSCTLREAVNQADNDSGDVIVVPPGTYTLDPSFGPLTFTSTVAVIGSGASGTTVSGGGSTQLVDVTGNPVTLYGLTLSGGKATGGGAALVDSGAALTLSADVVSGNTASAGDGGAVDDLGTLAVQSSSLTGNTASGNGGAIAVVNAVSAATATIADSTLSGNNAGGGGGLAIVSGGGTGTATATVTSTTIASNTATPGYGGGIDESGGGVSSELSLVNSTLNGNTAASGGGGITTTSGSTNTLTNDTLAGNSTPGGGNEINNFGSYSIENSVIAAGSAAGNNCGGGTLNDLGHNIDSGNSCGFSTSSGDQINTDPKLGPLQGNGGPTQTMAPLPGSPAINTGSNSGCPGSDQRGVTRPQQAVCDIGAYEVAPPALAAAGATNVGPTSAFLNATVANPDAQTGAVAFIYGTSTSYGSTAAAQTITPLTNSLTLSTSLSGLSPNTTYHYRVFVVNPDGAVLGPDQTFTTPAAPNKFAFRGVTVSGKGALTVKLNAPWSGKFTGKATFTAKVKHHKQTFIYGTGSVKAGGAGTVTLKLPLRGKAAKELKRLGKAAVTIAVTFAPTSGSSRSAKTRVTVKRSKRGKYS